jgi:Ca-activated chloride channel homolog
MFLPYLALWIVGASGLTGGMPPALPAGPPAAVALPASTLTVRKKVEEVRIQFAVRKGRKLVNDFSRDQLTVLDDGQLPAAITTFQREADLPLRIALLIDHSDSMQKGFAAEQQTARRFLEGFLRPAIDSVFVVDFSNTVAMSEVVSNPSQLSPVQSLETSGQTALYDAIAAASNWFEKQAAELQPTRRVIILLSDGEDNYSRSNLPEAIQAAQRSDAAVYAITAHSSRLEYQGDPVLRQLGNATGGRAFILNTYNHADRVFSEIEAELRTQYSITFRLQNTHSCGYHTIRFLPRDPQLRVQARSGYYACGD